MTRSSITVRRKLAIFGAVLGAVTSMLAVDSIVGQPARLVDLVGLFGAAFGSGAAFVLAIRSNR
jgi:hypothetical protein